MAGLFVDASYLVALADPQDPWNDDAKALREEVEGGRPLHIHDLAVAEVVACVGPRRGGTVARGVYESIRDDMILHVPTGEDLDEAMDRVVRYDGAISLSDAYALQVVEAEDLDGVASFDDDFDQVGVERVGA
jgi:predicted nucleic acid-binding protein